MSLSRALQRLLRCARVCVRADVRPCHMRNGRQKSRVAEVHQRGRRVCDTGLAVSFSLSPSVCLTPFISPAYGENKD